MGTSDRPLRAGLVLFCAAFPIAVASCAQVTGLSDDYRYDLDAALGTDSATDARRDAGDARAICSAVDRARATTEISNASGDVVPLVCRQCLAGSCCAAVDACAANADCVQSMRCVFTCQKENGGGNGKAQCLSNCKATFVQTLGPCIEANCAAPTCSLQ